MKKKSLQIPFYCVNSEVLWRGTDAVNNVIPIDQKIAQLNLDAIFTARPTDVPLIKAATNRIHVGVVYEDSMRNRLEKIKTDGADVLILDDIDQANTVTALDKIIEEANALGFIILARVTNPLKLEKKLLNQIQIIKWKTDQVGAKDNLTEKEIKAAVRTLKNENPNLSIIYGAKKISTSVVLNSLLKGMDGVGEYSGCKNTYKDFGKMLYALNDYKKVQTFINS
ncbi:hypothetical protein ACWOCJ_05185 [Enterococcus pseudoavium]|uniref:hypothetical protein n=1 Tax=Enterococcus pseudoavium TaxID=44007 RepID=UPI00082CC660|nr:hypothetical protein [Enterococcus pseudoavium]